MFKLLGPGVVRIGADDVNNSVWVPAATFVEAGTTSPNVGTAEVDALAQFLTATGLEDDLRRQHARQLHHANRGDRASIRRAQAGGQPAGRRGRQRAEPLQRLEHPEHLAFVRAGHPQHFASTLVAGPGIFEDINYATNFINGEGTTIDLVTHHYYRGQAGTSTATLANLMNLDSAVTSQSQALANAVQSKKIPGGFRWGEMNSYSSHGTKGVSDALASALWGINFMLTTAGYGSVGVNFHGGGQNMDGNVCPNGVNSCYQAVRVLAPDRGGQPRHCRPRRSITGCCWCRGSAPATC